MARFIGFSFFPIISSHDREKRLLYLIQKQQDRDQYIVNQPPIAIETSPTAATFSDLTDLSDTPVNYDGHGGSVVKVKLDESGVEFVVDTTAAVSFYCSDIADAVIAGYQTLYRIATGEGQSTDTETITADDTLIQAYITETNQPDFITLEAAAYDAHLHLSAVTAGKKDCTVYWTLTRRRTETYDIVAVNLGTKTFTILEDILAILNVGDTIEISGSTGNDGIYTVASFVGNGVTAITVVEAIPNAVADGAIVGIEQLMMTSEETGVLTNSETVYDVHATLPAEVILETDDRLVLKVYGNNDGAGGDPDATIYQEGVTTTRVIVAVPLSEIFKPAGPNKAIQFNDNEQFQGVLDLIWDDTNKRLGVGTASPDARLHVEGGTIKVVSNGDKFALFENDVAEADGYLKLTNSTSTANRFAPIIWAKTNLNILSGLWLIGDTASASGSSIPLIRMSGRQQNGAVTNRPILEVQNRTDGFGILQVVLDGIWVMKDNYKAYFGAGKDASIAYDGINLVIDPKEVGAGRLDILGDVRIVSGDLQGGVTYCVVYMDCLAIDLSHILNIRSWTDEVVNVFTAQPDVPRTLVAAISPEIAGTATGTITIDSIDADGAVIQSVIVINAAVPTFYTTDEAHAGVTQVTIDQTDATTLSQYSIGIWDDFGLPNYPFGAGTDVFKTKRNNVDVTVYTVDATYGTVNFTAAPTIGGDDFTFWYRPYK